MTLKPIRKVKAESVEQEVEGQIGDATHFLSGDEIAGFVEQSPAAPVGTPHHPWIAYAGADVVYAPDADTVLPRSTILFVAVGYGGKLNTQRMTVADLVARADSLPTPVLYRVA